MAAEETALTGVGELLFSLLIGYLGALEFAFVARHLYHWTFQHPGDSSADADAAADAEELPRMRERLDKQIKEAAEKEALAGTNVMQDGVQYINGIRVDPAGDKREALAAELARQQQIEADTRRQLAEAETKLAEERLRVQREKEESEQQQAKLIEAERQREREQAERELQEQRDAERRQLEAEEKQRKQREIEEKEEKERLENERKLIEAEREREENERRLQAAEEQREREESERRIIEAERQRERAEAEREQAEQQRILAEAEAAEAERRLFEAELQRERDQADEEEQAQRDAEIVERLLAAERELSPSGTESELEEDAAIAEHSRRLISSKTDLEQRQRSIEENARLFLEAEEEMVMLQQRQLRASRSKEEADEYAGMEPWGGCEVARGQKTSSTFPGVSDEGSSAEPRTPISSQQSSLSTQPSDEVNRIECERPEPEGEDQVQEVQYTEDYLRSLDGIKNRPLMREDGSGRRRAFKKRRSSGSSNSSRESRASRDEELKMFTSLEEEELRHGNREDYNPIKYTSEPTLKVKSHRRHKRSPAKDVRPTADSTTSLEMLGEESTNPWGEVVPEHYKDTEFWKREKALSIDEEEIELERPSKGEDVEDEATNEPKSSSFEEATEAQNEQAVAALKHQLSKEQVDKETEQNNPQAMETSDSNKSNLQTSTAAEEQSRGSPGLRRSPRMDEMEHYPERWSASQEQQSVQQQPAQAAPAINVQQPDTAPWRDQYGLLMEGLSDFYDFTASVNPSRSRSASRNPSPAPKNVANLMDVDSERSLEVFDDTQEGVVAGELNCESVLQLLESNLNETESSNDQLQVQTVADDAKNDKSILPLVHEPLESSSLGTVLEERGRESSVGRIQSKSRSRSPLPTSENLDKSIHKRRERLIKQNDELAERLSRSSSEGSMEVETNGNGRLSPALEVTLPQPVIEINEMADEPMKDEETTPEEMRLFVETLRAERNARSRSRSRSRSPLPTAGNIEKSLESRRQKRIQHNDEIFEKLHEQMPSPQIIIESASPPTSPLPLPVISIEIVEPPEETASHAEAEPEDTPESMARLFEQLRLNRVRSHSRSRSRSPLPTAANLEQSVQKRRERLIAQNDQFFEVLQERARTPEPETRMTVEYVYEYVQEKDEQVGESRDKRSLSPSRSRSQSQEKGQDDFHLMLNLEGSELRTLRKNSEELESVLAVGAKQREVDMDALEKLHNASEEIELRVLSPTNSELERVVEMTRENPDLDRTVSEVARDLQDELMASGFKRSTYVGESLDLGSDQFKELRREAAQFQRSRSPSPGMSMDYAREQAAAQRELQAAILDSLTESRLGAKPKTYSEERTGEFEDITAAQLDDLRHRTAEFQRSRSQSRSPLREDSLTQLRDIEAESDRRELQDQLLDRLAASSINFENFSRHLNADFLDSERRASDSALMGDMEPDEYHHFRRYSLAQEQPVEEYPSDDYVYISQIEVRTLTGTRTWLKEDFYLQEPNDFSDSKSPVRDEDSWARAVLAAEAEAAEFDSTNAIYSYDIVGDHEHLDQDRSSSNDSEDTRQTVVEIDDEDEFELELDEGISDNNERTQPTDESHHDTSECEEAERNADRYENRGAQDWEEVDDVEDFLDYGFDDGAVGGATPYSDPDSFIEQIYNEAIKNRKQSGILREYETMVQEQLPSDLSESEKEKSGSESEKYALWAKTRELERSHSSTRHSDVDIALGLMPESEHRDSEMRYLGDAHVVARQSTRLRTRYGFNPNLDVGDLEDDIEVDLNYKPKREYNWRKNFRLDDNEEGERSDQVKTEENEEQEARDQFEEEFGWQDREQEHDEEHDLDREQPLYANEENGLDEQGELLENRRMSLGGESITLFSRSPVREILPDVPEELPQEEEALEEQPAAVAPLEDLPAEKSKKKKSKKKLRKGSKTEEELRDDNDSDTQMGFTARSDDPEAADPPKRKTRSRRSSRSSLTNEEANGGAGLFSPRSSLAFVGESLEGIAEFEPQEREEEQSSKKRTKKRKKTSTKECKEEAKEETQTQATDDSHLDQALAAALAEIAPISVSTNLSPESTQQNLLSSISTGQSVCITPASSIEEIGESPSSTSTTVAAVVPARSVVDTFDILKDANFYPLF
ncbi:trichohyalin isoform X8 [Drosophila teissieri]|uniref:trichohyalin isoform X8 n=2 Tax=Drosophila teissieri TaxID=7243 RepID=UPI001CBA599B|nr:trichohyalin isoform X8 [Drosophila teissieri]